MICHETLGNQPHPAWEPAYCRTEAMELMGDDPELFQEMANLLIEDIGGMLTSLRQAIDAEDKPGVTQAAHAIKGVVTVFAAQAAAEDAAALETLGRDSCDLSQAGAMAERLSASLERLVRALQADLA